MPRTDQIVMDIYFNPTPAYTVRTEMYNGSAHLVVPVVMMVEGVHSGSHGPILHLADELGRIPDSWNGMPVTIGHPKVGNNYVPANSPEVLRDWAVGTVFNSRMENNKLHAEAWIEQSRLQALSVDTLARITAGEIMEVSVGVFSDSEQVEGVHNNESYVAIARNHRPDHLALLPGEVGACSIADGCGLRVNQKGGTKVEKKPLIVNEENVQNVLKELNAKGFSINQVGFLERADKAQRLLDSMDGNGRIHWLDEILSESELVYRVTIRQEDDTRITKYFRQTYIVKEDGNVELTGEPVEVKKEVMYTTVPQTNRKSARTNFNTNQKKEVTVMAEKCTDCVKKLVDGLIANKATAYSEDHRVSLEAMEESMLEMMTPEVVVEKKVEVNTEAPKLSLEGVLDVLKDATEEQFLNAMPAGMKANYESAKTLQANVTGTLVTEIMENTADGTWTKEGLEALAPEVLKSIHTSANITPVSEHSFIGNGSTFSVNSEEAGGAPLMPVGFEEEAK